MKGNGITRKWPDVLTQLYLEHRDWNAAQFQRQLVVMLSEDKAPGLSAVQKRLPEIRERYTSKVTDGGLDAPWQFGLAGKYPVSSDSILHILAVQKYTEANKHPPVSVAQAIWIGRLSSLVDSKDLQKRAGWLWFWSRAYALEEIAAAAAGDDLDTSELDACLRSPERIGGVVPLSDWAYLITMKDGTVIDGPRVIRTKDGGK